MSIELKQAAQDAAEAIDWLLKNIRLDAPHLSGKAMGNAEKCASALRTAIQQAAVPMTDEERKLAAIDWSPCVRAAFNAGVNAAERHHGITAQATQAEVTDEKILSLDCVSIDSDEHGTSFWVDRSTVIKFARAILALRTERVPMTREQVFASDELMAINGSLLGLSMCDLMQVIRIIEAHHGITAQAKKEGV